MGIFQNRCNYCLSEALYSERWSSVYCDKCNRWLNAKYGYKPEYSEKKVECDPQSNKRPCRPLNDQ